MDWPVAVAIAFLVSAVGAVGMLTVGGESSWDVVPEAAIVLPGVVAGRLLGNAGYSRVDERCFRQVVCAVLLLSAAVAVGTTLLA